MKATPRIPLFLILAVAALLRFGWLGVTSFGFDEVRVSHMALQMAHGDFAELGMQSSSGVPNFPAAIWLYAIPYAITNNPQLAIALTALVNTIAVAGVYWLGRRLFNEWAGLAAATLFATSPFLVYYSRSVWSQNWLAPLAVLWAVAAVKGVNPHLQPLSRGERRARASAFWLGLHVFLAGFVGQVHIAGFALGFATLVYLVYFRMWRAWKAVLIGGLLAALLMVPTVYTIVRFGDGARVEIGRILNTPSTADFSAFTDTLALATGDAATRFWLNRDWQWGASLNLLLQLSVWLLTLLLIIGALNTLYKIVTDNKRRGLRLFLLAWTICAPLLFFRSKTGTTIHYHLTSLPALLLLIGASFEGKRWWRIGLATLIGTVAVVQVTTSVLAINIVRDEQVSEGMGTPLLFPQNAANRVQTPDKPVVVETFGSNFAYDGDAATFDVLLWNTPRRIVDAKSALLLPDEPFTFLFTLESLPAYEVARSLGWLNNPQPLPRRANDVPFVKSESESIDFTAFTPVIPPVSLNNGARLQGWRSETLNDGHIRLLTYWQLDSPLSAGHFQQFNHLYLIDGTEPAAVSDIYTSSSAWQVGDRLVTWAEFAPIEGEIAFFDVGMYTWPDLQRVGLVGSLETYIRLPVR